MNDATRPVGSSKGTPCPSEDIWAFVAAGAMPSNQDVGQALLHAAGCARCAALLREALDVLAEPPADMQRAETEWQPRRRWWPALTVRYYLAAAAVLLIIPLAVWIYQRRARPPLDELAIAPAAGRQLEARLQGEPYAPFHVRRGAAEMSAEFLEGRAALLRQLPAHSEDPLWMQAAGRAALVEGQPDAAIHNFQSAEDLGAKSASFYIDYAAAWLLRADQSNQPADDTRAVEFLSRALAAEPANAAALFSRGLAYSKLAQFDSAIEDFEKSVKVDPASGWAAEAKAKIEEIRARRSALFRSGEKPGPEQQLEEFLASDGTADREGLRGLAALLEARHDDAWLTDALAASASREFRNTLGQLAGIRRAARSDRYVQLAPEIGEALAGATGAALRHLEGFTNCSFARRTVRTCGIARSLRLRRRTGSVTGGLPCRPASKRAPAPRAVVRRPALAASPKNRCGSPVPPGMKRPRCAPKESCRARW